MGIFEAKIYVRSYIWNHIILPNTKLLFTFYHFEVIYTLCSSRQNQKGIIIPYSITPNNGIKQYIRMSDNRRG